MASYSLFGVGRQPPYRESLVAIGFSCAKRGSRISRKGMIRVETFHLNSQVKYLKRPVCCRVKCEHGKEVGQGW
jgi:hypothetical protein